MKTRFKFLILLFSMFYVPTSYAESGVGCITHASGKYAACLQEGTYGYVGVLKRLADDHIVATVGGGSLECLAPHFVKTKFGEEMALFRCFTLDRRINNWDLGINLCGHKRNPGYLESQNGHIPFVLKPSTKFKLNYEIEGEGKNRILIKTGAANFRFSFNKEIVNANYIEYAPDEENRLQTDYYQITFADQTIRFFRGAFEHYYAPNGHMSPNPDELCLSSY